MILVRDGVAASGERVLAVGLIFRRPPSEGAARHVELVGQPLDRDLSLENQSRGGELELPVVAFLNTFPIEALDSPCPLYCPSPIHDICNGGLDAGMGASSPKHAAELKQYVNRCGARGLACGFAPPLRVLDGFVGNRRRFRHGSWTSVRFPAGVARCRLHRTGETPMLRGVSGRFALRNRPEVAGGVCSC